MNKKIEITFEDYEHFCSDGCCHDWGTITRVNGVALECTNTDKETIIKQILEHLGFEPTIINNDETI